MLVTLNSLGMRNVFDAIYGASAGAINATFFIAGGCGSVQIRVRTLQRQAGG